MVFGLLADIRKEIEMTEVIPQVGGGIGKPINEGGSELAQKPAR